MSKLLLFILLSIATWTQAQTIPSGILPSAEEAKYRRQHDSMQVLIAKRRREIGVYNRAHPLKKRVSKPSRE